MNSRVVVYVDGFNLYHGLKAAYGRRYLWLDLPALSRLMLIEGQELVVTRYFTALVRDDAAAGGRQADYLEALRTRADLEVNLGRFQRKNMRCFACGKTWTAYEEKETDVAIATAVVRDAARHSMDTAIVVSGDGDLLPALRAAKDIQPAMAIVCAFPPRRRSEELASFATASFMINENKLSRSQLPGTVQGSNRTVTRPSRWSR